MPIVLCRACGQKHDSMLVRCPTVVATAVPYRGRLVDIVQEELATTATRPLKKPMVETREVRVSVARKAMEPPECNDPKCGYRKLYEDRKSKHVVRNRKWRATRK